MDEFDIIADLFRAAGGRGRFRPEGRCRAVARRAPGIDLVVTTDAIAEGVDFFAFDPPDTHRAEGAAGESVRSGRQGRASRRIICSTCRCRTP